jgi:hypothetical protein
MNQSALRSADHKRDYELSVNSRLPAERYVKVLYLIRIYRVSRIFHSTCNNVNLFAFM